MTGSRKHKPVASRTKQRNLTLQERSALFTATFSHSLDGMAFIDPDSVMRAANESFADLVRMPLEHIVGHPAEEVIPGWTEQLEYSYRRVLETGKAVEHRAFPFTLKNRPERGIAFFDSTISPVYSGNEFLGYLLLLREVTEQKLAENLLKESEEKHRTIIELASVAILTVLPPPGGILEANQAALRMLGYSLEQLRERGGKDIIAPEVFERTYRDWTCQLKEKGYFLVDTVWVRKDGTRFPVEVSGKPFDLGGRVFFQLIGRDISEWKRLADEREKLLGRLRAANERLVMTSVRAQEEAKEAKEARRETESILDRITDGFVALDRQLRFTYLNRQAEMLFQKAQLPREALLGKSLREVFPQEADTTTSERLQRAILDQRTVEMQTFTPLFNIWIALHAYPSEDGLTIYFRDITEQKLAEEALRESEERFRWLAEHAPDVVFRFELQPYPGLSYISPAITRLSGYTVEECYDDPDLVGKFIEPEDRYLISEMINDQDVPQPLQVRWRSKSGHKGWAEISYVRLFDSIGNLIAVEGIARDVTERKQMEEQLLRAQRLEMAGRIAGQVAHDFNNLLSPLAAYPELIKAELPADHPAGELCDSMLKATQQIADINDDLLTLSRRGHFNQEQIDLNQLIEQSISQLPQQPGTLAVKLDLANDLLPVAGSPAQLSRVVSNLLTNAREAMHDAGALRISTRMVHMDRSPTPFSWIREGDHIKLEVSDTGVGIPPEIRDKIFDPFFTTKRTDRQRGSGLGLSIVQAIVEDHNGCIEVESQLEKGTTFRVFLPASRETRKASPLKEYPRGGNETILVVDDDKMQREVIKQLLDKLGYRVDVVGSGEEALRYLQGQPADLVILDMVLETGIDGAETYRKAVALRPGLRAVILSGFAETERVQEARALGAGAYLRKPVALAKLAQTVREELERSAVS